ncbi:CPBP family intramembrane glutamic endopeptidase [Nonomuraea sp. NPDC050643]|uniref:CPBP family intramembrane glutamic endopeptidase n=1 Tax=Nonomuraea sp. NPDC050643 TaxID=3155660 RepID=UPI003401470C
MVAGPRAAPDVPAGAGCESPWPAVVIGSLVFASLHGYTGWGIVEVFTFGMFMGWLTISP